MNNGWTPLHIAALNGHEEVVAVFIAHKADIDIVNNNGETPLYIAAEKGHRGVMSKLVDANADSNIAAKGRLINLYNQLTPLMVATKYNHAEAAWLLRLETRVINTVKSDDVIKLMSLLTKLLNPNITDSDGNNLLHLAVKYNRSSVLYELVKMEGIQLDASLN
ncbi:hypothetical protein THRCLA_02161 [Thraustotheca clavata]|uniref:Uncharacterized protein n=1 Tax=Thraustotheca clavata TaxID=74557 RepID=A0A1W0A666_9STRA|nr:hypothetical protein THRCLA_02161 [Thraustotheca clavata]